MFKTPWKSYFKNNEKIPGNLLKNLEKSWKYHGILSVRKSGNPDREGGCLWVCPWGWGGYPVPQTRDMGGVCPRGRYVQGSGYVGGDTTGYSWQVGSMHPTGMLYCENYSYILLVRWNILCPEWFGQIFLPTNILGNYTMYCSLVIIDLIRRLS